MTAKAAEPTGSAVSDAVADVRSQIASGHLRPGDPVAEEDVAQRLGISRTPVREAIGRLVSEGLLTKGDNRSARVFRPSLQELLEIYEIRLPLEVLASGLSVENADDDLCTTLRQQFAMFTDSSFTPAERFAGHEDFHLTLFRGSGRTLLVETIAGLRLRSEPYVRFAAQLDAKFRERSSVQHVAMIESLAARDRKRMERLVRQHLKTTTDKITELLNQELWLPSVAIDETATPRAGRRQSAGRR